MGASRRLRVLNSTVAGTVTPAAAAGLPEGRRSALPEPAAAAEPELSLTDAQRDACIEALDRDSFCVLPVTLPQHLIDRASSYIDGYCSDPNRYLAPAKPGTDENPLSTGGGHLTETNIVEQDPVFRELLSFKPSMQLCYDVFGPLFHLGQVGGHDVTLMMESHCCMMRLMAGCVVCASLPCRWDRSCRGGPRTSGPANTVPRMRRPVSRGASKWRLAGTGR
eukprot:COSAG01_NODE_695_length_14201_cov_10.521875_16_plen_222_part_00